MDVLFVSEYDNEQHQSMQDIGVELPQPDTVYTVRAVRRCSAYGIRSFLLHEIRNPPLPYEHPVFGRIQQEYSFDVSDFTNLEGLPFHNRRFVIPRFVGLVTPKCLFTHIN